LNSTKGSEKDFVDRNGCVYRESGLIIQQQTDGNVEDRETVSQKTVAVKDGEEASGKKNELEEGLGSGGRTGSRSAELKGVNSRVVDDRRGPGNVRKGNWERIHDLYVGFFKYY